MRRVIRRGKAWYTRRLEEQRGAVLILTAATLVILMGMAAFAVDFGWIAYNRLEVRKAAESAALAGVVHMPLPGGTTLGPGEEAWDTAVAIATQAGYTGTGDTTVVPEETSSPNQLKVTVTDQIDTFFMKVFYNGPVTVRGDATAEQLPPLKLGSDESFLGNQGLGGTQEFWIAINGPREAKSDGDPYTTKCISNGCSTTSNPQTRSPSYYYAVEVPPGYDGQALRVDVFDGTHKPRGTTTETGDVNQHPDLRLRMNLYPPDSTPNNWFDNSTNASAVCNRTFWQHDQHPTRSTSWGVNEWRQLTPSSCGGAVAGIYVLEVSIDDAGGALSDRDANTQFSLRARVGGADGIAQVYGLGAMGLYMNASSSNPTFKLVRLDQIYAGTELIASLYDPGDISGGGTGSVEFTGAFAGIDCEVQVRRDSGQSGVVSWRPDSSDPHYGQGAGTCGIPIKGSGTSYNGDWVDFKFDIPSTYTCSGAGCWGTVSFSFSGSAPQDTTAWTASINGTPVHLEP